MPNNYRRYSVRRPGRRDYGASAVGAAVYSGAQYAIKRLAYKGGKAAVDKAARYAQGRYGRKRYIPKQVSSLKHQVRELRRIAESDMGTHTQRSRTTGRILSAVNTIDINSFVGCNIALVEAALAELRYYDIKIPGTLLQVDGDTGTFQKEFFVKQCHSKMLLRNNYQVATNIKLYLCVPRVDTSIQPHAAVEQGFADIGNPGTVSLMYPSDSPQFGDLWVVKDSKSVQLQPGDECIMNYSAKEFQFDPSLIDSHALTFQPKYGAHAWMVRIEGVLSHDTSVTTEQTVGSAGVDFMVDQTLKILYSAGADIKFIGITNIADSTFTNSGVSSNKPVSDNQTFTLA